MSSTFVGITGLSGNHKPYSRCAGCGEEITDGAKRTRGFAWHQTCHLERLSRRRAAPWRCAECGTDDRLLRNAHYTRHCHDCARSVRREKAQKAPGLPYPACSTCTMRYHALIDGQCPLCIREGVTERAREDAA